MKQDWKTIRVHNLEYTHVRADGSRAGVFEILDRRPVFREVVHSAAHGIAHEREPDPRTVH